MRCSLPQGVRLKLTPARTEAGWAFITLLILGFDWLRFEREYSSGQRA